MVNHKPFLEEKKKRLTALSLYTGLFKWGSDILSTDGEFWRKKIGFVLGFNVTIWSCCSYFTVHHLVIAVFWYYRQIAINHMDMAIKKKIFLQTICMRKQVCHDLSSLSGWPSETQKTRSRSRREDKVCVLQLVLWIRPMPHIRDNPAISQHQGGPTLLPTSWWRTSPLIAAIFIWIPDLFYKSWNKSLVKSIEILCPIFGLLYMYISLIFFFFFKLLSL